MLRVENWKNVRDTWSKAGSFLTAVKSRGIIPTIKDVAAGSEEGVRVDDETLGRRKLACFGNDTFLPCAVLKKSPEGFHYCGACGCGANKLALLDDPNNPQAYTKLHYPELQCPLKRKGFSNHPDIPPLSIIIPVLNDNVEVNLTIESIRKTSPNEVEIIVVDDHSDVPVTLKDSQTILVRQDKRGGAGRARHVGAELARSEYLLLLDSHMRFTPGWYAGAMKLLPGNPKTLWCATCLGLDEGNMDVNNPKGNYTGANLVLFEPNGGRVFEGVWMAQKPGENYEIPCVMGACYFIQREWFLRLGGLKSNSMWGSEEPFISVKSWLCGGEVRLMSHVKIGHKFRSSSPYQTEGHFILYNKLRSMMVLFPPELYDNLANRLPKNSLFDAAIQLVESHSADILAERNEFQSKAVMDVGWLMDKFQIPNPLDEPEAAVKLAVTKPMCEHLKFSATASVNRIVKDNNPPAFELSVGVKCADCGQEFLTPQKIVPLEPVKTPQNI